MYWTNQTKTFLARFVPISRNILYFQLLFLKNLNEHIQCLGNILETFAGDWGGKTYYNNYSIFLSDKIANNCLLRKKYVKFELNYSALKAK